MSDVGQLKKLGGIGEKVAQELEEGTGKEARSVVLGHLLRGGSPTSFDRLMALRFGAAAVRALDGGQSSVMDLGICFGDDPAAAPSAAGCGTSSCRRTSSAARVAQTTQRRRSMMPQTRASRTRTTVIPPKTRTQRHRPRSGPGAKSPENGRAESATSAAESAVSARSVGLHYVSDSGPGIRRVRAGKGFRYLTTQGGRVRDPAEVSRIRSLAIPPAWNAVWICASPRGHIQAVGRDARLRKQYRYHPRWREVRDANKFGQMIAFAESLPALRRRIEKDLRRPSLPREKVLATVVSLLETTLIRVGNEEYARTNQSFGLTTLRDRHVDIAGRSLEFRFRGKSGKQHVVRLSDRRLVRIVKACQDIPGYELFQYIDLAGRAQTIDSADVNAYLREIAGTDCTAKLFRTWAGTTLALNALRRLAPTRSPAAIQRNLTQVVKDVAKRLGNTPAICRRCYIHPEVIESYLGGSFLRSLAALSSGRALRPTGLDASERLTLSFLRNARRRESH